MIQILNYGQVDREKIFSRVVPEVDVEAIVSQIIQDVRKNKDQPRVCGSGQEDEERRRAD